MKVGRIEMREGVKGGSTSNEAVNKDWLAVITFPPSYLALDALPTHSLIIPRPGTHANASQSQGPCGGPLLETFTLLVEPWREV
ncbi:hypothetical protein Pmani_029529 [Petrolisthes manimaculis]|uniref:Uncharacterized protein n=1 Tax=Petrolisthes manimaculis TaxID=1843537 RepID=A0AAE1NYI8_9EUCA|nr:hypothetical protein Pmani_029529 [Petrolisthes manimaculis]